MTFTAFVGADERANKGCFDIIELGTFADSTALGGNEKCRFEVLMIGRGR